MCIVFIVMIIVFIGRCYNSYADVRFLTLDFMISIPYFINRETNKCVDWLIDSIHYTTLCISSDTEEKTNATTANKRLFCV